MIHHSRPFGKRVKLKQFCNPAQQIPEGTTCSVCLEVVRQDDEDKDDSTFEGKNDDAASTPLPVRFALAPLKSETPGTSSTNEHIEEEDELENEKINGEEDNEIVVTKCGHFFHQVCLDGWVNDPGMEASNTCPSCRTKLCDRRQRRQVSSIEGESGHDGDEAWGSDNGSSYHASSSTSSIDLELRLVERGQLF
jgi:hypothetical protein